jgi:Tol biopolymer transport system component
MEIIGTPLVANRRTWANLGTGARIRLVPAMDESGRLDSWKQIASHFGKSERTVRRWQQIEGLPVHRHLHQQRGSVWAYRAELDQWLARRQSGPGLLPEVRFWQARIWKWSLPVIIVGALASVGALTISKWPARRSPTPFIPVSIPQTALPGLAYGAAFSPDGGQLAFNWSPASEQHPGIYLKWIGSDTVTPLVAKPAGQEFNYGPAWSPDGKTIAFLRRVTPGPRMAMLAGRGETWLCLVSVAGGPVRLLLRLATNVVFYANSTHLSWTPDGQWIVAPMVDEEQRGIYKISVATRETRRITNPPRYDYAPLLSPDGRALVFMRQEGPDPVAIEHVMRQNLTADGSPEGSPQLLYEGRSMSSGLAWTPSGKELIFCMQEGSYFGSYQSRIYRMPATSRGGLIPIGLAECSTLALSRPNAAGRVKLIYGSSARTRVQLWRAQLDRFDVATEFVPSSSVDGLPSFSSDGSLVAFVSERSGKTEVWVARQDGTGEKRITEGSDVTSTPRWSPDGRSVIYGAVKPPERTGAGLAPQGVYIVPVAGGTPARVPLGSQPASDPSYSPDGQWFFYWSGSHLWRARVDGTGSALVGEYSTLFVYRGIPDGEYVYYSRPGKSFTLCRAAVRSGMEKVLVDGLLTPFFVVTRKSVYFIQQADRALYAMPLSGGPLRRVGVMPGFASKRCTVGNACAILGMAVSPDDAHIIWAISDSQQGDLQLVDGFY